MLKLIFRSSLSTRANQKECFEFLISHDKWKEALSVKYKEEYAAIEDKRKQASEPENPDWVAIGEEFNQALMGLTKKALGEFTS